MGWHFSRRYVKLFEAVVAILIAVPQAKVREFITSNKGLLVHTPQGSPESPTYLICPHYTPASFYSQYVGIVLLLNKSNVLFLLSAIVVYPKALACNEVCFQLHVFVVLLSKEEKEGKFNVYLWVDMSFLRGETTHQHGAFSSALLFAAWRVGGMLQYWAFWHYIFAWWYERCSFSVAALLMQPLLWSK